MCVAPKPIRLILTMHVLSGGVVRDAVAPLPRPQGPQLGGTHREGCGILVLRGVVRDAAPLDRACKEAARGYAEVTRAYAEATRKLQWLTKKLQGK